MNVELAAQVLSHSVSSGLFSYVGMRELGRKCLETGEFLYNMNKLFDSVNGRTLQNANKDCDPVKKGSYYIEFWKSMIPFIESWKIISSKSNRKICAASKKGWIITLMSFIQISEILFGRVEYFLTGRFNQDCLENMFSTVRRCGGFSDNPDCLGFRHIIHKIIIANFFKKTHPKNCADDGDYTLVDFAKYDKPTIIDIINSNSEDPKDNSEVNENDADILINDINVIECNVLAYICGYFAKKFLNSHECTDCKKLLMDETKALDTHTIALYFKDYDHVNSTSGLKWPTKKLLEYFTDLHNIFHCNINLLYLRSGVCHAFYNLLFDVSNNLFENHSVHKIEAQNFFVNSYVRMMVKHNIKQLNNELKINAPPPKKMKYNLT